MNNTTFNLSHFSSQNTPPIAQIVGDISLTLATIAGIPLVMQQSGMAVPHIITVIATFAVTGGAIVKFVSKMWGVTDSVTGQAVNPNPAALPTPVPPVTNN